jgi:hypothetical protein
LAAYSSFVNKEESNYQIQMGVVFPYERCPELRQTDALDLVAAGLLLIWRGEKVGALHMSRLSDLVRFYALLDRLKQRLGGTRSLATLNSFRDGPTRGVYFFFEPFEARKESGDGPRVVRVGTHALTAGSRSTLRQRLIQHRGQASGLGNHRGSIFRLLVGEALLARGGLERCSSRGVKGDIRQAFTVLKTKRRSSGL